MNLDRMVLEFKVEVDKVDSFNSANFLQEEIDIILQNAYEAFIETRMSGLNIHKTGFEETQKRIDDLKGLMKTYNSTTFSTSSESLNNSVFVDLPSDYRHAIQETVFPVCSSDIVNPKEIEVIPIKHGMYNRLLKNPFSAPSTNKVLRLAYQNKHELIYKDININAYRLRYIKEPLKIDVAQIRTPIGLNGTDSIELDESTHREIVQIAARMALQNINSPRYQEKSAEITIIE